MAEHLGGKPRLLLPLGGETGAELAGYLHHEGILTQIIRVAGSTRVNVIITTSAGRQMRFNPQGPCLNARDWQRAFQQTDRLLRKNRLLILSGSLPRGWADDSYAVLIALARRFDVKTLLDCDGATLKAAIPAQPFLVKPNEHELAGWCGKPLRSESEIVRAARAMSAETHGWVLVSRGAKRSLLVNVTEDFLAFAAPRRVKPRNTVGAGDALLAAVADQILRGRAPLEWLRVGLTTGTAATQCQPGELPH